MNAFFSIYLLLPFHQNFVGEARYDWEHAIPTRKIDVVKGEVINRTRRLSVTMRKVRSDPCACEWAAMCDSQFDKLLKEAVAPTAVEMEHVHKVGYFNKHTSSFFSICLTFNLNLQVYNTIASHFSHTRYAPWPKVQDFLAAQPPGSIIGE